MADLFSLLLQKEDPVLRPAINISTTIQKFEAFLPEEFLACISPGEGGSRKSRGGRPKKDGSRHGAEDKDTTNSPEQRRSGLWKKSSYVPFLYNAYPNARARREDMAAVFRKNPEKIRLSAEHKAQAVLYHAGEPCFQEDRLEAALTDPSCIPMRVPGEREQYISKMRYYMRISPEKAFSRALLTLMLADERSLCMDLLFPEMEYTASDHASLLFHADHLFRTGHYQDARNAYQAILDDPASSDRAEAALKIGRMYRYGYGVTESASDAYAMFKESCRLDTNGSCPDALYELYLCEKDGEGIRRSGAESGTSSDALVKPAWEHLQAAAKGGSLGALLEIGSLYYSGSPRFSIQADLEKAADFYRRGALKDDPACKKMYARCLQLTGKSDQARYWYFRAARQGDVEASVLLSEFDISSLQGQFSDETYSEQLSDTVQQDDHTDSAAAGYSAESSKVSSPAGLCFTNAVGEMTETFLESLPAGWIQKPFGDFEQMIGEILEEGTHPYRGKSVIVFLGKEAVPENIKDLQSAITLLEHLPSVGNAKEKLIEHVHFFLRTEGNDDLEIKMTDSFNSVNELRQALAGTDNRERDFQVLSAAGQKNRHYHIRICNPLRDASEFLLSHAPLFLPALQDKRQIPSILFLGGGDIVPRMICDILSVFPVTGDGKPLNICVLAENADNIRERVEEQIPELTVPKPPFPSHLCFITLSGHHQRQLFTGSELKNLPENVDEKELKSILFEANYYIVSGNDERENVQTATWLRGALLASSSDFSRLPFIAAYVRSSLLSQQAAHFSVINEGLGFSWYNNYNIFCFGSNRDLYTYDHLENGCMEKRALNLHLSNYPNTSDSQNQGEADYWRRFYNRDSSHMSALSIIYKAYLYGITLPDVYDYGQRELEAGLADPMEKWLADPEHLENAARAEHERWVCFACSRGWRPASAAQLRSYLNLGNPRQQLYLARLHPCIVSWMKLPEVQHLYNELQRQRNPDWKDRDLIQSDYDIIENIPALLRR